MRPPEPRFQDIAEVENLEITIKSDGQTVWIDANCFCALRVQRIKNLTLTDERRREETPNV